jgi:hypothetical protein
MVMAVLALVWGGDGIEDRLPEVEVIYPKEEILVRRRFFACAEDYFQ